MTDELGTDVDAKLQGIWWLPVVRGIILLIVGFLMLAHPFNTAVALVWVFGIFAVAGIVFSFTRLGRDLIALGSDRRASIMTGVSVDRLVIGSFVFSAMAAALGGTLLSMGLASASPSGLSDVLVPAVEACCATPSAAS